jgi:nicotinamide mononucleotide transporter
MEKLTTYFSVFESIEWLGFLCTLIYLYYVIRLDVRAWYWSIAGSLLVAYTCFANQLYMQTGLYAFYLIIAFFAIVKWKSASFEEVVIIKNLRFHLLFIFCCVIFGFLLGWVFSSFTDQALPYLDGLISVFGIGTTLLVVGRNRENWLYWMAINMASMYLYFTQELFAFVLMSIVLLVVAFRGYVVWRKV